MKYLFPVIVIFLFSCKPSTKSKVSENTATDTINVVLSWVEQDWIDERVENSKTRLEKSEAGNMIWNAIEAHGGLNNWFASGPISFHFDYQPLDGTKRRNSYQIVDKWSVRAVHEVASNRSWKYGWDGENAWSFPDSVDVGVNPRFWSTTPYYFIGLPFVFADEGVILEYVGEKEHNGNTYDAIKATYESNVGDAPDDFYIIYLDQNTSLLAAIRYIVSYPGFFPYVGHSPEKLMEVVDYQTVDRITLPTGYKTYWFREGETQEHITNIDVTEVMFDKSVPNSYFDIPAGAKVQEGY